MSILLPQMMGAFQPAGGGGGSGIALELNGSNQYALGSILHSASSTDITLSFWVYPHNGSGSGEFVIDGVRDSNTFRSDFGACFNSNIAFFWNNSVDVQAASALPIDTWSHVVMVVEYSNNTPNRWLYIDGSLNTTGQNSWSAVAINSTNMAIGCDYRTSPVAGTYFDGMLSDIRIYDATLSASEVADVYAAPGELETHAACVAQYLINGTADAVASTLTDEVGSHDLATYNSPYYRAFTP